MDYKKMMGYDEKKKESKPKVNKVLNSIKEEFGYKQDTIKEGPSYEYKKHSKKIDKSLKDLQKNFLDFYENLRKKGLTDAADDLLDSYKNNVIKFGLEVKKIMRKII